ncbi:MAG: glycosyltransferase [Methanophagales archaeon]|nr:glycosyltransferase [Methanophagales archaeon]
MLDTKKKYDLAVVIITKNEEEMIADCTESTLSALDCAKGKGMIKSYETILADSASTDRTIEIAKQYPIKIVQLNKNWQLSSAAGLYIGYLHSNSDLIYFLGGDMVLDKNWFVNAIPYLSDDEIGAVSGIEDEFLDESTVIGRKMRESAKKDMPVGEVEMVGTAIFKRKVLEEVGQHNPYLKGGEDRDLAYRIRSKGYKLLRINIPSVSHYWAKKDGKLTLKRYLKSVYAWSRGEGQAMRYSISNKKIALKYLKRYVSTFYIKVYGIIFLFISLIYMNILTFLLIPQTLILAYFTLFIDVALLGLALSYAFIRYKGRKWKEFIFAFHIIPYVFIRHTGFIRGFLKKPKDPSTYPTDVKIIKE